MQVSAEIRWFWPAAPDGLGDWFLDSATHGCAASGGNIRIDQYLRDDTQGELGLKHRAGQPGVEIKGLITVLPQPLVAGPLTGAVELWGKWFAAPLALHAFATVTVEKRRWLRQFASTGTAVRELALGDDGQPRNQQAPTRGCTVELTQVTLADGSCWWTLGCETFGTLTTLADDLRATVGLLASRRPPSPGPAWAGGYPAWLAQLKAA